MTYEEHYKFFFKNNPNGITRKNGQTIRRD